MNKKRTRIATAVIGSLAAAGAGLALAPAEASAPVASHVTAKATDSTPAAGATFRVSGTVSASGHGVPATIAVQSLKDGTWVQLTGASMHTTSAGKYTIRVILSAKGARHLRVVADPDGSAVRTSKANFTVTVG
ncbi:MAG TPA: hypothetical protein VHW64_12455 [Nocardioides sp.]|jgi:hypothetical protein|uniref:hypothetical protein n=1 Tax=Nocardioides sp. TaxID=35761 RepID=UPI002E325A4C|nr:hypothetical protein [Nocardioides sp.]HEX3931509.1 hypothetical protein [Nocardioides sp.]